MIARKYAMLVALGACLLGLSGLGSTKNPVTRPMIAWMTFHVVIDPRTASFEAWGAGHGTHTGQCSSYVAGQLDLSIPAPVSGQGNITAANGDQLFVKMVTTPSGPVTVITGGTGRFEGATGSSTETLLSPMEVTIDPPFMIIDYSAMEVGTITY